MAEETVETTEETSTSTETTPEYFGSDGTLAEGWQSTLPEGYRDEASLKTVKDSKILAKMFVDTKRMVGKNTIAIPDETSPKDEWSEYYRHGGRPDTVEDYGLVAPEGFPAELTEQVFPADRIAKWQQRFFDGGVSKKAAAQFIAEFANDMMADIQSTKQNDEFAMTELKNGLYTKWGKAYEQKVHIGNVAVEQGSNGDEELKARLTQKFGNDPDFIEFASNIGAKFVEHGSVDISNLVPTPSDLQAQIDELRADPRFLSPIQSVRDPIIAKVNALTEKKMAQTKTTP